MEARIARLESDVAHLVSGMADVKGDVRSLRDKVDAMHLALIERSDGVVTGLSTKIDGVATGLNTKIDGVVTGLNAKIDALNASVAGIKVWVLTLQLSIGGAILAAMARGFGWI